MNKALHKAVSLEKAQKKTQTPQGLQACQDVLTQYVKDKTSRFVADDNGLQYHYSNYDITNNIPLNLQTRLNTHGKENIPVVEMRNGYYIYCNFKYVKDVQKKILSEMALQFFDEQQLICRAEWADKKGHPQPHWHLAVDKSPDKVTIGKQPDNFFDEIKEGNYSESLQSKQTMPSLYERLHFYMLGQQSANDELYVDFKTPALLINWFKKTMSSFDKEYRYIHGERV